jgi:hypothetical protein
MPLAVTVVEFVGQGLLWLAIIGLLGLAAFTVALGAWTFADWISEWWPLLWRFLAACLSGAALFWLLVETGVLSGWS